jgi:DNA-binding NarL/FixJ family response regulator
MASKKITCLVISGSKHISRAVELYLDRVADISTQLYEPDRKGLNLLGSDLYYDCVILDLSMLNVNKPEIVQKLKKSGLAGCIIVIDTEYDNNQAESLLTAGADECMNHHDVSSQLAETILELHNQGTA